MSRHLFGNSSYGPTYEGQYGRETEHTYVVVKRNGRPGRVAKKAHHMIVECADPAERLVAAREMEKTFDEEERRARAALHAVLNARKLAVDRVLKGES